MAAPDPDKPRTFITKVVLSDTTRVTVSTIAASFDEAARITVRVCPTAADGATLEAWTDEVRRWKLVGDGEVVWS